MNITAIIKNKWHSFINKGVPSNVSDFDIRTARYFNLISIFSLFLFIPIILFVNVYHGHYEEVVLIIFSSLLIIASLLLSYRGATQKGITLFAFGVILVSYIVVYLNTIQTAAPYVVLVTSLSSLIFIKNNFLKIILFISGFSTFTWLNYYQLTTRIFDIYEYVVTVLILLFFARGLKYIDTMRNKHELRVIQQNEKLLQQNQIIKEKTSQLVNLEKEKHERELLLQQKELEMVLSTNTVQIQLKENIIERLKYAQQKKLLDEEVNTIILELYQQNEIQKKIELLQGGTNDLNTNFFNRLQELHPKITKTDREFCSYIKLGMTTKEIALTRNTSTNTVNVAKTRLRKRLGLEANQDMMAYLLTI